MFRNEKHGVSISSSALQRKFKRVDPSTAIGGQGDTLLHTVLAQKLLSEEDFEKVSEFFRENTFLLTERNSDGNTPIHVAAEFIHSNVIATAFSQIDLYPVIGPVRIVNVMEKNKQGKNPLHLAVENKHLININNRHLKSVQIIVEYLGAFINVPDEQGRTPLHIAILAYIEGMKDPSKSVNYYGIVEKLLNIPNIDTEITDNDGNSIYDDITRCGDKKLIALFIEHYSKKKAEAKLKLENSGKSAKRKENLSKRCNLSTVGLSGAGGVFTLGHEYHNLVLLSEKAVSILKFVAVAPSSASTILLPIALYLHYQSSRCKKEYDLQGEDIEKCKIKIEKLYNILKNIEHNEVITRLENSLQESQKELKELSEIDSKLIADSLLDIKSLLEEESCRIKQTTSTIVLTNIEQSCDEHRRVSCIPRIMQYKANRKNSEVLPFTIPEITYSESIEGPSSSTMPETIHSKSSKRPSSTLHVPITHANSVPTSNVEEEDKYDFRPRTSSCGARFNVNRRPSTTLQSPQPSIVKKDVSCGRP
ncbi:ankyrin repeat domain-containing protein [Wolbachia endosymbiont of Folsomia candida]|uniref:ankyrin repeat domain-containing protein n=1 Tax=Wolbachia endosymbiont of Folsomia candida TaxID=169402 RepID=UPI000AF1BBDB|nr:ankyrin repeat domain-containing protein [Wolbachia endosymbiont of Folsomia candida]APR98336.1 hypothetical protein ASM33_03490 [Wolbachia endosymbiont of Folsomia candida]